MRALIFGVVMALAVPVRAGLVTFDFEGIFDQIGPLVPAEPGRPVFDRRDQMPFAGSFTFDLDGIPVVLDPDEFPTRTIYDQVVKEFTFTVGELTLGRVAVGDPAVAVGNIGIGDFISKSEMVVVGEWRGQPENFWTSWRFSGGDVLDGQGLENIQRLPLFEQSVISAYSIADIHRPPVGGFGLPVNFHGRFTSVVERVDQAALPTPEPSTLALAALGLAAWKLRRRASRS